MAAGKAMSSERGETALTATADSASTVEPPLALTATTWVCKSGLVFSRVAKVAGPKTTLREYEPSTPVVAEPRHDVAADVLVDQLDRSGRRGPMTWCC